MVFVNDIYEIRVERVCNYSANSTDNKHYDKCVEVGNADVYGHYTSYEMEVLSFENGKNFTVILLASYCSKVFENSGILEEDVFYLILDNQIIKMDLKDLSYAMYSIPAPFGTYYEMYDCSRGFLVYGEIELVLLDREFNEQWRYCTQDILFGADCLHINEEFISFTDYEGNYHEMDWNGKQLKYEKYVPKIVTLYLKNVKTPVEFQNVIKRALDMTDYYGRNWDAYWDAITGLITLPDELILEGWHEYKSRQKEDAVKFEQIMNKYNALKGYKHCECVYKYYV